MTEAQVLLSPYTETRSEGVSALKRVGILIATYQEVQNIERLIYEIEEHQPDAMVLVVDDASPDGTSKVVEDLQMDNPNILLYRRPGKLGLGTAITDGFKIFLAMEEPPEIVVTLDADYSHDPKKIDQLVSTMGEGCDIVVGSRYIKGGRIVNWPPLRRIVSRSANFLVRLVIGLRVHDCTSGFRCYSTKFLRANISNLHSAAFEIEVETLKQAKLRGFSVVESPIVFENRRVGKSKLSIKDVIDYVMYIVKNLSRGR